jgi:hypothetical protein
MSVNFITLMMHRVLREAIVATVEALAAGKIKPEELAVPKNTDTRLIRYVKLRTGTEVPL